MGENFDKLLAINLFNCHLKDSDLAIFLYKLLMIEEISLSNNLLENFNFKEINNTLRKIDLSHNKIKFISNFNPKTFNLLEHVDLDFNYIFSLNNIREFLDVQNLKQFYFYFNPLPKNKITKIKSFYLQRESNKIDLISLKSLLFSEENNGKNDFSINKINMENDSIKNVDIIYDSYSFTDRFANYTKSSIFKEKCIFVIKLRFQRKKQMYYPFKEKIKNLT